ANSPLLMEFSRELRGDVISGDITVSFRLWRRPEVRVGGRYPVGPVHIEIDSLELMPFSAIAEADMRRCGEKDRESLRERAAHASPIAGDTLLYRVEFHLVGDEPRRA
ncbi:MAG TPA: hypothetical protein VNO54_14735, partial [Streptosporangiaceae bacterium]|nr:hypothetical protein [Streptosporangiaceae bacterium]